jgi:MEMO1 family protein
VGAAEARLIRYGTSGDASGDYSQVVGYAGIRVS